MSFTRDTQLAGKRRAERHLGKKGGVEGSEKMIPKSRLTSTLSGLYTDKEDRRHRGTI